MGAKVAETARNPRRFCKQAAQTKERRFAVTDAKQRPAFQPPFLESCFSRLKDC
jgi:hypothetical protein